MPNWVSVWPIMNQYKMFYVQTSTWLRPNMCRKFLEHGRNCMHNNELLTKSHVELEDNKSDIIEKEHRNTFITERRNTSRWCQFYLDVGGHLKYFTLKIFLVFLLFYCKHVVHQINQHWQLLRADFTCFLMLPPELESTGFAKPQTLNAKLCIRGVLIFGLVDLKNNNN